MNPQLEEIKELRPAKKGKKKGKAPSEFREVSPERARVQTMMASEANYDIHVTIAKLDCLKRSDITELKALMNPP